MGYITASQAAKKWNISQRRVQILCAENRIEGVLSEWGKEFITDENTIIPLIDDEMVRKEKRQIIKQDIRRQKKERAKAKQIEKRNSEL